MNAAPAPTSSTPPRRTRPGAVRGSVLITALLFASLIAIALTSYIRLTLTSLALADRSFYQNSAVNLAEVGIEEALYCFNRLDNVTLATSAWASPWSIASDNSVTRTLTDFTLGPGVTAVVKVYANHYNPSSTTTPIIVSRSIITFARGGPTIEKYMEVTLRKRSLWVNGLVAKEGITWVGHPAADSWNSDPDNNPATAAVAYSASVQGANCTVAAISGNISLGSGGDIFGYAKTSSTGTTSGGSVHGLGTSANDPSRITNDFSANLPPITVPSATIINYVSGTVPTDFPLATHLPNTDGKYYFSFASGRNISTTTTVGSAIPNAKVVFLMLDHQGTTAIGFTGTRSLTVKTGSQLTVYTNGDISAFGNGIVNGTTAGANQASALTIYGTTASPSTQSINIGGNGQLYAAIYAPQGVVEMRGGGSSGMVLGSIVAKSINMNGGTDFHYDEALGTVSSGNPFGIVKWRELQSAAERATYASQLAF